MKKLMIMAAALLLGSGVANAQISFTANPTSGCAPLTVAFTNTSTAGMYYSWYWGDGSQGWNGKDTSHTFMQSGNYNVQLNAQDSLFNFIGSYSMNINVSGKPSFIQVSADSVCMNELINFSVPNNLNTYLWNFGDGTATSDQSQPNHSYNSNGTYTVELICSVASCGTDTLTTTLVVTPTAQPNAQFYCNTPICPKDYISIYPYDSNEPHYLWYFGNGDSAVGNSPQYAYSAPGKYPITLKVTNVCGNSSTATDTIQVSAGLYFPNWVNLSSSPPSSCPHDMISLQTNYEADSYFWNFGDGDTLTTYYNANGNSNTVSHAYKDTGTYTASLYMKNGCGHDTTISTTVKVGNNIRFSQVQMQINAGQSFQSQNNAVSVCPDGIVYFSTRPPAQSYVWHFGDGQTSVLPNPSHSYTAVLTDTVSVTLSNGCGIDTTLFGTVTIDTTLIPMLSANNFGTANNTNSACPNDTVIFYSYGGASYLWLFGDGGSAVQTTPLVVNDGNGGSITVDIVKHAYTSLGNYTVELYYTNGCGKTANSSFPFSVLNNQPVNGGILLDSSLYPADESIKFLAYGGDSYKWYFGDGDSAVTDVGTTTHTYTQPGNYNVSVVITNSCLSVATYTQSIVIQTVTTGIARNSFETSVTLFPNPTTGRFTVQSSRFQVAAVEVFNVLGKKVYQVLNLDPGTSRIVDLSSQPAGIYFVRLQSSAPGGEVVNKKVIVE